MRGVALLLCWTVALPASGQTPATLESRIAPLVKAHRGKVAVAIKHLDNGESYYLDADEEMPTASLIKFMIMLEVYMQFSEGKVKLDDMVTLKESDKVPGSGILTYHFSEGATFPLRDATRIMMVYSDNTATNLVLDKIGLASTNERLKSWGFEHTRLNAKVFLGKTTSSRSGADQEIRPGFDHGARNAHLARKGASGQSRQPRGLQGDARPHEEM